MSKKLRDCLHKEPVIWNNLGAAYNRIGKFPEAIKVCEKIIEVHPEMANPWNHLGLAHFKLGDSNKAIKYIKNALNLNKKYAGAYCNLANIYLKMNHYKKALKACKNCLDLDPNFHKARKIQEEIKDLIKIKKK